MNKLIDIHITNNTLLLKFENDGYIRLNNLDYFDYQIKNCDFIDYLQFFASEQENYRFICANNGKAILIDINDSNFLPDDDENWHAQFYENVNNFLEANFIVNNVVEQKELEQLTRLRKVFEEIEWQQANLECEKDELYIKNNINKILSELRGQLSQDEFNFLIVYLVGNYDFEALKDGLKIKISKSLKNAIRNYVENKIYNVFQKHELKFNIDFLKKFCPPLKSKRLTYYVEVEQIGANHQKTWLISKFSYSKFIL